MTYLVADSGKRVYGILETKRTYEQVNNTAQADIVLEVENMEQGRIIGEHNDYKFCPIEEFKL